MPANPYPIPKYRKQKAKPHARASVGLDGKQHYLGHHSAPKSRRRCEQVVAEELAGRRTLPVEKERHHRC